MIRKSGVVISLIGIIILLTTGLVAAQAEGPIEEWVANYHRSNNGGNVARAIAVDNSGNVYVTGGSSDLASKYNEYSTIKYDSNGNRLWIDMYHGSTERIFNCAYDIVVDLLGNVYVTGSIGDAFATIKYDKYGNQIWVSKYNGPTYGGNGAIAMVLDEYGNVYVTGTSWGGMTTQSDWATIKYDSNGNQLWAARYDGPGNVYDIDEAKDIAVDGSGNVYVTGFSEGLEADCDYLTVKYNSDGDEIWVARYNGPDNARDEANAVILDSMNNVYVTGSSYVSRCQNYDYATIKYNSDGIQQWIRRYDGLNGCGMDKANAIALDASGNIYVTGESSFNYAQNYATIKYDSNGNQLWMAKYSGPEGYESVANDITLDEEGNIYVTGKSWGPLGHDYATIKYDNDGRQLWAARYTRGCANAIVVDSANNVYVTGYSDNYSNRYNCFTTIKYSQSELNLHPTVPPLPPPQTPQAAPKISILVIVALSLLAIAAVAVLVLVFRRRRIEDN